MSNVIFKRNHSGQLEFIGNFDKLYKNDDNPWGQALSEDSDMLSFYNISRSNLIDFISKNCNNINTICEIGSGTGHVARQLSHGLGNIAIDGCDISHNAVKLSQKNFNTINFYQHDILKDKLPKKYDVVILSNILWYVIHDFKSVIKNSLDSLNSNKGDDSYILIQNALFKSGQEYAAEIVRSPGMLVDLLESNVRDFHSEYEIDMKFSNMNSIKHSHVICSIRIIRNNEK